MLIQKHEDNGLTSAPTLIYGGRGMDGRSYIRFRGWTAAVNLTAESAIEPPRGGEHGAGENLLNRKRPFAESRN